MQSAASGCIRAVLTASSQSNSEFTLVAGAFQNISEDHAFTKLTLEIVLDQDAFERRAEKRVHHCDKRDRVDIDRFYAAAEYLWKSCRTERYSASIEPLMRTLLESKSEKIKGLQPAKVERGNGDDRIRAAVHPQVVHHQRDLRDFGSNLAVPLIKGFDKLLLLFAFESVRTDVPRPRVGRGQQVERPLAVVLMLTRTGRFC